MSLNIYGHISVCHTSKQISSVFSNKLLCGFKQHRSIHNLMQSGLFLLVVALRAMQHVRWRVVHTLLFARVHPHALPVTHAQLSHRCEKIMLWWSHPLTLTSYFNLLSTHTSTFHRSSHACTQTLLHNGHILAFKTHKMYYIAHNTTNLPHDRISINMGKHKSSLLQADQADGQGLISVTTANRIVG